MGRVASPASVMRVMSGGAGHYLIPCIGRALDLGLEYVDRSAQVPIDVFQGHIDSRRPVGEEQTDGGIRHGQTEATRCVGQGLDRVIGRVPEYSTGVEIEGDHGCVRDRPEG